MVHRPLFLFSILSQYHSHPSISFPPLSGRFALPVYLWATLIIVSQILDPYTSRGPASPQCIEETLISKSFAKFTGVLFAHICGKFSEPALNKKLEDVARLIVLN